MQRMEKQPKVRNLFLRLAALILMVGMLAALFSQSVFARNSYVITDGENVTVHQSYSTDPDVVLDEVGIELSDEDTYTTSYNDGVSRIDIQRMQLVTVDCRGELQTVGTYGETVRELLERLKITPGMQDTLSCDLDQQTYDGLRVDIVHTEVKIEQTRTLVPFETKYYEDPELEPGSEVVLIEGKDGMTENQERVVYENGKEISREVISTVTVSDMVTKLVIRGPGNVLRAQPNEPEYVVKKAETDGSTNKRGGISGNTITTESGVTYTYSYTLGVTCTAYSCEGYTGITATGTVARVGAVAVDPRYIPLGTKMYIVSNDGQYVYGYCVAEDTGGSIKGYKIDLYFDTVDECWDFGVRSCTAYILQD
ncbi:MAG: G5 domain-containing protein [Oscillospiraceae bacterium]|nr:G5 domain-containing protein [Oscillospiraceae bacterium]